MGSKKEISGDGKEAVDKKYVEMVLEEHTVLAEADSEGRLVINKRKKLPKSIGRIIKEYVNSEIFREEHLFEPFTLERGEKILKQVRQHLDHYPIFSHYEIKNVCPGSGGSLCFGVLRKGAKEIVEYILENLEEGLSDHSKLQTDLEFLKKVIVFGSEPNLSSLVIDVSL